MDGTSCRNNITGANICGFSLLSDAFDALELAARCDISSFSTVSVFNCHHSDQQIEAILNRLESPNEFVSSSMTEWRNQKNEFEQS
jgi:hypothetical protein